MNQVQQQQQQPQVQQMMCHPYGAPRRPQPAQTASTDGVRRPVASDVQYR